MIHYHGTDCGGPAHERPVFLQGRHALVPFLRRGDLAVVAEVCQSFIFDNSAYTAWQQGNVIDFYAYAEWCVQWSRHPGFDWALIPDVIDGAEEDNDALLLDWPSEVRGVPVWHFHESLSRLDRLVAEYPVVALGSSGEFRTPNSAPWWGRMREAMKVACDELGRPRTKLHGLRMLNPQIFTRVPLASGDSTNAVVNAGSLKRFGMYMPPTRAQRAQVIAARIEAHNSAARWISPEEEALGKALDELTEALRNVG